MRRAVPRLSASLLIVDRSRPEPHFLFGRRHNRHVFMPNRYVFPGGKVDGCDSRIKPPIAMNAADHAIIEAHLSGRHHAVGAHAVGICAIREAWEESGNLIGKPAVFETKYIQWQAFVENDMAPDLSALRLLARAITPASMPYRYDTWFFLMFRDSIALSVDVCGPESELDHQIWASEAQIQTFDLPSITRMILREAVLRLKTDPELVRDQQIPMFASRGNMTRRTMLKV
jgi:8-oxo-dGTP pyrophosphatase MutT (NUDIX family)